MSALGEGQECPGLKNSEKLTIGGTPNWDSRGVTSKVRNNLNRNQKYLSGKRGNEINQHKIRRSSSEKKLKIFHEKETVKTIPFIK